MSCHRFVVSERDIQANTTRQTASRIKIVESKSVKTVAYITKRATLTTKKIGIRISTPNQNRERLMRPAELNNSDFTVAPSWTGCEMPMTLPSRVGPFGGAGTRPDSLSTIADETPYASDSSLARGTLAHIPTGSKRNQDSRISFSLAGGTEGLSCPQVPPDSIPVSEYGGQNDGVWVNPRDEGRTTVWRMRGGHVRGESSTTFVPAR